MIGFDKLVSDAHKRNRVLFDKLNLPATLSKFTMAGMDAAKSFDGDEPAAVKAGADQGT